MAFTDLIPVEERSLEDRAHPLTFSDDKSGRRRLDGMATGKLPQPRVFDIHTKPDKLMAFGKSFAVDGVEFSHAARNAGIHNYTAEKFIRASGLRAKKVQEHITEAFEYHRERKASYGNRDSKWKFIMDAIERSDRFAFDIQEPYSKKLQRSIRSYLGSCIATHRYRWSITWDHENEKVVVRRTGTWFPVTKRGGRDRSWMP